MTINHPVRLGEFASLTWNPSRKLNLGKVSVPLTGQLAEDGTTVEVTVGEINAEEVQRLSNVAEEVFTTAQLESTVDADEDEEEEFDPGENFAVWTGVLGMEGVSTGDGRLIETGALNWQTPQDFRSVKEDVGGHDGAVVVGTTLFMDRGENGEIFGTGTFDLGSDEGMESRRQVEAGISTGVSFDLDDMTFEVRVAEELIEKAQAQMDEGGQVELQKSEDGKIVVMQMSPDDEMHVITSARVRASTRVSIPAFAETGIKLVEDDEDSVDGEEAMANLDPEVEGEGVSEEELSADLGEFKNWVSQTGGLPKYIRRIADQLMAKGMGESRAIASAVNTAKRWARGGTVRANGGPRVTAKTVAKAAAAVASWYSKRARANAMSGETESMTAAGGPVRPPREWFSDPKLTGPSPLRVMEDGRVFGHVATWDSCHIGYAQECTAPPESRTGYAFFLSGGLLTDDGSEVSVGHLTLGTGHADEKMKLHAAAAHYDNTGTVMADVSAGEDAHGIWVAGGMRSDLTEAQVRAFRSAPLSGDWRMDQRTGNLEMVAALSVNVPGFPIPRPKALVSSGQVQSLVASGIVEEEETPDPSQLTVEEVAVLRSIVVETQERERIKKAAALADRVKRITEGK